MADSRIKQVRRSKQKSFYLRELSTFLTRIAQDEPAIAHLYITRVELSPDGGMCYIYFSFYTAQTDQEKETLFKQARDVLVLYKPSLRKALSSSMHSRYVPDLRFVFDQAKEKEHRVSDLLTQVSEEIAQYDEEHPELVDDE